MSKNDKGKEYRIERFSPNQLATMYAVLLKCQSMLPKQAASHKDVYQVKGWMRPYLLAYEGLLWGRWNYWAQLKLAGTAQDSEPIPQISFIPHHDDYTYKMLNRCIDGIYMYSSNVISDFADWLLWGLGDPSIDSINHIETRVNEHFYKEFDLFFVLDRPTDYLSGLLADHESKNAKAGRGYFPTPFHVVEAMTKMTMTEESKFETVCDPCIGCGVMLLSASNYSLRGYGMDISAIAIKFTKIQCHWYAPWYADPQRHLFDFLHESTSPIEDVVNVVAD